MSEWKLYHFKVVGEDNLNDGYIGVCHNLPKRKHKHLHQPVNSKTREVISSGVDLEFKIIYKGSKEECLEKEFELRPKPNIVWNVTSGGDQNRKYPDDIKKVMSVKKMGNCNVGKGSSHHFYGRTGKDAVRYDTKGEKHPNHIGFWITPLGSFGSRQLAADANNVSKGTVLYRCKQSDNFPDWHFKEKDNEN